MYYLGSFAAVILKARLCEASGSLTGNYVTASVWCTTAHASSSEWPEAGRKLPGKAGEMELLQFLEARGRPSSLQRLQRV